MDIASGVPAVVFPNNKRSGALAAGPLTLRLWGTLFRSPDAAQSWSPLTGPPDIGGDLQDFEHPAWTVGGDRVHLLRMGFFGRTTTQTEAAPTVTLSSGAISAGQRMTVTYRGTPGSTLQILSKTQPASGYSVIGTITLDSNGFGTSTHAPQRNTRIMAETQSGLSSGQPLIQVHSVASFSAKRVATRTYTFTGRVYPALNQRLVSVYRNGVLFAQGRCDANGIYVITKAVAAGTFSFYSRTSNDIYNLGVTSSTIRFTSS